MGEILSGGGEGPRLGERWGALSRRVRRLVLAAALCALLAAGAGYALAACTAGPGPPRARAPHRVPYPVQSTSVTFVRVLDVDADRRTFRVELRARTDDPVLIQRVTQDYSALDMTLTPSQAVKVAPGSPSRLWLHARVLSCRGLPTAARLPFLQVTLRNARTTQDLSFIPGDHYARSLTRAFRTVCGPSSRPSVHTP